MNKYLELLEKMKASRWNENDLPQLTRIEAYIKEEISSEELLRGLNDLAKITIYLTINKLLNYEERDIRYYMQLPQDRYLNGNPCIMAGQIIDHGVINITCRTIGPKYMAKKWPDFSVANDNWTEIVGDFSQYPDGVMLFYRDWFRIIAKYPNIYEEMGNLLLGSGKNGMTMEQLKAYVDGRINSYINLPEDGEPNFVGDDRKEAQYLQQEIIDSIRFIIPTEYLKRGQVLSGAFGTFEEVLSGDKSTSPTLCKK